MTMVVLFFALLGWKCLEVNEKGNGMRDSPLDLEPFHVHAGHLCLQLGLSSKCHLAFKPASASRDNIHLGSIEFCSKEAFNFMLLKNSIIGYIKIEL